MDRLGAMSEVLREGQTAYEGAIGQSAVRLEPAPGERWRLVLVEASGDIEVAEFRQRVEPNQQTIYVGQFGTILLEMRPSPEGWVMFADRSLIGSGRFRF